MNKKQSIQTVLGPIQVYLDGEPTEFKIYRLKNEEFQPQLAKRFLIEVYLKRDGKEHVLSCRLEPSQTVESFLETGERCLSIVYQNEDESYVVMIGGEGDDITAYGYDYDICYQEYNGLGGLEYYSLPSTKTSIYKYGVMCIDITTSSTDDFGCYNVDPACIGKDDIVEEL